MQGRGVTNYSADKPSHAYTTQTTEFDDALLDRGIITFEQAMMAKGATPEEAKRLAYSRKKREEESSSSVTAASKSDRTWDNNEGHDDDDDDRAVEALRTKRMQEIKHGNVIPISRTQWNEEINNASHSQWVVILLTSSSASPNLNPYHQDQCLLIERDIIPSLAGKFSEVKWVSIPSKSAIENWPDENLPTIFCYRMGKLQCQLVGLGDFGDISKNSLEFKLGNMGVLETDIEVDPSIAKKGSGRGRRCVETSYGRSKFQGGMSTFATGNNSDDASLSDYDDVD